MSSYPYDIIIHGSGPVGCTIALALAQHTATPERIAICGHFATLSTASSTAAATRSATPDPRTIAINQGSRLFIEQLKAWPQQSADITTVHVSQKQRLGRTIIRHHDLNVARLGSVVRYDDLITTLHQQVHNSGVSQLPEQTTANSPQRARVTIISHGQRPQGIARHYNQHAVLGTVEASRPKTAWAYERFTQQGPLALLPHPENNAVYAVVWCCPPKQAQHLNDIPEGDFNRALNAHFGERLGNLKVVGNRHVFPLSLHAGPILLGPNTIAIGNAAQTLHPVAGQGLNLGLRDVAQLSLSLAPWLANPERDAQPYLQTYVQRRHADRWLTAGITDLLPRIFVTGNPLVEHACGLALLTLDMVKPLRNRFARHLLQGLRV